MIVLCMYKIRKWCWQILKLSFYMYIMASLLMLKLLLKSTPGTQWMKPFSTISFAYFSSELNISGAEMFVKHLWYPPPKGTSDISWIEASSRVEFWSNPFLKPKESTEFAEFTWSNESHSANNNFGKELWQASLVKLKFCVPWVASFWREFEESMVSELVLAYFIWLWKSISLALATFFFKYECQ